MQNTLQEDDKMSIIAFISNIYFIRDSVLRVFEYRLNL